MDEVRDDPETLTDDEISTTRDAPSLWDEVADPDTDDVDDVDTGDTDDVDQGDADADADDAS
jgi:hypothetical protein